MAEDLRKAELVRDRLEGLDELMGPTRKATTCGRGLRPCISGRHSKGRGRHPELMDALQHPRGT